MAFFQIAWRATFFERSQQSGGTTFIGTPGDHQQVLYMPETGCSLVRPVRTDGQTKAICHMSATALSCANGHSHISDASPPRTCIHLLE